MGVAVFGTNHPLGLLEDKHLPHQQPHYSIRANKKNKIDTFNMQPWIPRHHGYQGTMDTKAPWTPRHHGHQGTMDTKAKLGTMDTKAPWTPRHHGHRGT